jgi:hypothetical protein
MDFFNSYQSRSSDYDHFLAYINNFHQAEMFMKRWISAWGHKINYPFVGFFITSYSELMYEWNRFGRGGDLNRDGAGATRLCSLMHGF